MSDGTALVAAILAEPDEDTPRLVYADWLDENDQPEWAEYIRLQIFLSLNHGRGEPTDPCVEAYRRERELGAGIARPCVGCTDRGTSGVVDGESGATAPAGNRWRG